MSIESLNSSSPPALSPTPSNKSPMGIPGSAEPSRPTPSSLASPQSELQPGEAQKKEAVRQAVQRVNNLVTGLTSDLKFFVDEETGVNVVQVIDVTTKEVIRQIPAQEMLDIARRLDELRGLLIKEKA